MTAENKSIPMKSIPLRMAVALAALATLACLSACSRTDNKPSGQPEKITIANIIPPFTVPVDVAWQQGYFSREGLAVTMRKYPYGLIALQALLEGKADFATVAETPIMLAIMKGEKLSIIATIQSSKKNNAIIARRDLGINTPRDLKGRRMAATFGTISEFFMDGFLALNGISRSEMKVVDLKPEEMSVALASGEIDAASTWTPPLMAMQKKLGGRGIIFYNEEMYSQTISIVAKREFIHANPGKVEKLLRALVSADDFIMENPAAAQKIVAEYNRMDAEMLREMWADNKYRVSLEQSLIMALEDESEWAIKHGLTSAGKVPNFLDFVYFDGLTSVKPSAVRILR